MNTILEDLGLDHITGPTITELQEQGYTIGRIVSEQKERYTVITTTGATEAEITGHMRFTASEREDFPAVGDWVALQSYESGFGIIHRILPRKTLLARQAAGRFGERQVIAANIDYAFIVQSVDRDFNLNRMERYLTLCYSAKVKPIILLTKIDLLTGEQTDAIKKQIRQRVKDVPVVAISNTTHDGYAALRETIRPRETYCLLGSSGVGKSSLINNLTGETLMKTAVISQQTSKGRHTTTHRELTILPGGGILIDNPGMREVGITESDEGIATTYQLIYKLSAQCKFTDCSHTYETGCAVKAAVQQGEIDQGAYDNYLKMEKEKAHFESTLAERRKKDKDFGKMIKNFKKNQNKNKN